MNSVEPEPPGMESTADGFREQSFKEQCAAAVLSGLFEPGRLDLYALVVEHGHSGALDRILTGSAAAPLCAGARTKQGKEEAYSVGERLLEQAQRVGARLILPGDGAWPARLTDLAGLTADDPAAAPPTALWMRGHRCLAQVVERSVAIVGARAATGYGRYVATDIGGGLARAGWSVISGGAYGIDAAAHRGAMAASGVTVAVLACGVDIGYPPGNKGLLERIAETGIVVSELPPGSGPRRHRFLVRNRVIAALGVGALVVEAASRSGSRVTARRAEELGRSVMAVPGPVNSRMSVGTHELIRDWGARLVTSSADVIAEVGQIGEGLQALELEALEIAGDHRARDGLDACGREVLDGMPARGCVSIQDLAVECGLTPRQVRSVLPDLVARGFVAERSDGYTLM